MVFLMDLMQQNYVVDTKNITPNKSISTMYWSFSTSEAHSEGVVKSQAFLKQMI